MADVATPREDKTANYTASKVGNWFLTSTLADEVKSAGVLGVTQSPGNLKDKFVAVDVSRCAALGAPDAVRGEDWCVHLTVGEAGGPAPMMEANGAYIVPWGQVHPASRQDLLDALKSA